MIPGEVAGEADRRLERLFALTSTLSDELRWASDDDLFAFRRDAFHPPPSDPPLRSLSAAARTPDGPEEFIDETRSLVGDQLLRFVSEPVLSEALALPVGDITAVAERFVANPNEFVKRGVVRQLIGQLVSRAVGWLMRLLRRIGGALTEMIDDVLHWATTLADVAAAGLLGVEEAKQSIRQSVAAVGVGPLWSSYSKQASRLDKIVAGGGVILGILTANPFAGVILGLVGATVAVWLGSDHLGIGGVFNGRPNLMADDLAKLFG